MSDRPNLKSFPSRWLRGWRELRAPAARPWLAMLLAGLVVTLSLVLLVRRLEDQSAQAALISEAEARLTLLESNLARAVDGVAAVAALFDGRAEVTRAEFAHSTRPILARQPAIRALEWVPLVHPDDLPDLKLRAAAEGFPSFGVTEFDPGHPDELRTISPRAEYFPVWYVEPLLSNERVFGFDLGSDPARRAVLQGARNSGGLLLSSRIALLQDSNGTAGALLVRPVFGLPAHVPEAKVDLLSSLVPVDPSALRGFVLAVLRIDRFVAEPLAPVAAPGRTLGIYLFDELAQDRLQPLYPANGPAPVATGPSAGFRVQRHLALGGRRWLAVVQSPDGRLHAERTASRVVLLAGVLISILLARLQFQSLFRARAIHDTVERRTSELLASERRLIQLNQEALQAAQAKTVFLASMTHEFRTPMNAILGLLAGLRRSPLADTQRDQVDKASGAAHRLLRLVEDILDLSRIEAGRLAVERHPFFLETVLRDVVVACVPRLADKPVELVCDLDPHLPARLIGDGMRLTQVLVNLTENACKFTRQGEVVLRIEMLARLARRVDLRFSVADSGPGLGARDVERLFKPFAQAEQVQASEFGGTGLGLAIVRQLVDLLGGDIRIDTRLGHGSRFEFDLSMGITDDLPLLPDPHRAEPLQVLLLEPNLAAAASLERLLQAAGASVQVLADADPLAATLQARTFALVLMAEHFERQPQVQQLLAAVPGLQRVVLGRPGRSLRTFDARQVAEKPLLPSMLLGLLQELPGGAPATAPAPSVPAQPGQPPTANGA